MRARRNLVWRAWKHSSGVRSSTTRTAESALAQPFRDRKPDVEQERDDKNGDVSGEYLEITAEEIEKLNLGQKENLLPCGEEVMKGEQSLGITHGE